MKIKPDRALPWPLDYEGGVLPIAEDEGCRLQAYQCQAGKWTCGWGETQGVTPSTSWTQSYADQRFCDSLTVVVAEVKAACKVEPSPNQLAALVRFAYNYGGWRTSNVMKAHNRGDFLAASRSFGLVNKFTNPKTGKLEVSDGLTARRAAEAAQYLRPSEGAHAMPQEVAGESRPAAGPIATSGTAVATAGGIVATLGPLSDQIASVKTVVLAAKSFIAETLGVPPSWVLPLLLIGAGVVIVRYRLKQRAEGWA